MKIVQAITLPIGQIGLAVEGYVKWAGLVRHVVGGKGEQAWDFHAQKIVLKDDTGEIMVEVSCDTQFELRSGDPVGVKGGTLGSYMKKGVPQFTLEKCKFAERTPPKTQVVSKTEPMFDEHAQIIQVSPIQKTASQIPLSDMRRERGVAFSYCIDVNKLNLSFKTDDEREAVYDWALQIADFVITGINPYSKKDASSNG